MPFRHEFDTDQFRYWLLSIYFWFASFLFHLCIPDRIVLDGKIHNYMNTDYGTFPCHRWKKTVPIWDLWADKEKDKRRTITVLFAQVHTQNYCDWHPFLSGAIHITIFFKFQIVFAGLADLFYSWQYQPHTQYRNRKSHMSEEIILKRHGGEGAP